MKPRTIVAAIAAAAFTVPLASWAGSKSSSAGATGASFDQADANHDGKISRQEFSKWSSQHASAAGGATSKSKGYTKREGSGQGGSPSKGKLKY